MGLRRRRRAEVIAREAATAPQVLVVQEKTGPASGIGLWKMPGGASRTPPAPSVPVHCIFDSAVLKTPGGGPRQPPPSTHAPPPVLMGCVPAAAAAAEAAGLVDAKEDLSAAAVREVCLGGAGDGNRKLEEIRNARASLARSTAPGRFFEFTGSFDRFGSRAVPRLAHGPSVHIHSAPNG
jgi:hypothetical protein